MDEPPEHYIKWNMSITYGQALLTLLYNMFKVGKLSERQG